MWAKPWRMAEGLLIGGGLVAVGLMLQLSIGSVNWGALRFPVNIVLLIISLALFAAAYLLRRKVYAFRFLATAQAAVPALGWALVLTIVMGLTRQLEGGTWLSNMLSFWPFVLIYIYLVVILSQVILRRLAHFRWRYDIPFLCNHCGLLIALVCGTLGSPDMQRLKMITAIGEPEWRALTQQGRVVELPIAIELKRFIMEQYDDGSPRRFASEVLILTQSGQKLHATVEVNKPVIVEGWSIYQFGYDTALGPLSRTSILELVRDPWLPAVYVGIWLMMGGAVLMLFLGVRREGEKEYRSKEE